MNLNKRYLEFSSDRRTELTPTSNQNYFCNSQLDGCNKPSVFTTFSTFNLRPADPEAKVKNYRPALFFFSYHLERLLNNASALEILKPIKEHQREWIAQTVLNELKNFAPQTIDDDTRTKVRLILEQTGLLMQLEFIKPRWDKLKLIRLGAVHTERPNAAVKSTDTKKASAARERALDNSFDEALLIDSHGFVREGSWSNIFWFDSDSKLYTVKSNVLPGVTRRIIIESNPCNLVDLTLKELLKQAREVFVSQSTTGVIAVSHIDQHQIGTGLIGPNTKLLQDRFWALVEEKAVPIHDSN
jgi:branched-subunit amino acid aminotransferase/4-amino-4-deoxychorismate lyase